MIFKLIRLTNDANSAHAYLSNFISFAQEAIGVFGVEKGLDQLSSSEWAAGPGGGRTEGY